MWHVCEGIGGSPIPRRSGQGAVLGSLSKVGQVCWALLLPGVHPVVWYYISYMGAINLDLR